MRTKNSRTFLIEGFTGVLQDTMEVFCGPGLRYTYAVRGESFPILSAALTCSTKPHDQSPIHFCSGLAFHGLCEDSYEMASCSLGLYASFLSLSNVF